jgi:hypothetical protein
LALSIEASARRMVGTGVADDDEETVVDAEVADEEVEVGRDEDVLVLLPLMVEDVSVALAARRAEGAAVAVELLESV